MNPNTCSDRLPEGLHALAADVDDLAAQDLAGLPDAARAERVLGLRRLLDRLEGQWLGELAAVDACGGGRGRARHPGGLDGRLAAGPPPPGRRRGQQLGADGPGLVRRPLTATAQALGDGELWAAHASVLAYGTHDLPRPRPRPSRSWWMRPDGWTHPSCDESSATCG
jgi:hypothetical protein